MKGVQNNCLSLSYLDERRLGPSTVMSKLCLVEESGLCYRSLNNTVLSFRLKLNVRPNHSGNWSNL